MQAEQPAAPPAAESGGKARTTLSALDRRRTATNVRITALLRIPVIVVIGIMGRDTTAAATAPQPLANLRAAPWTQEVAQAGRKAKWPPAAQAAACWGGRLAAVADITLVDLRCAFILMLQARLHA